MAAYKFIRTRNRDFKKNGVLNFFVFVLDIEGLY